jgi:hypothetical protein
MSTINYANIADGSSTLLDPFPLFVHDGSIQKPLYSYHQDNFNNTMACILEVKSDGTGAFNILGDFFYNDGSNLVFTDAGSNVVSLSCTPDELHRVAFVVHEYDALMCISVDGVFSSDVTYSGSFDTLSANIDLFRNNTVNCYFSCIKTAVNGGYDQLKTWLNE